MELVRREVGREAAVSAYESGFVSISPEYAAVVGTSPRLEVLASSDIGDGGDGRKIFHEAGVWVHQGSGQDEVWFTSNMLPTADGLVIGIHRLFLPSVEAVSTSLVPSSTAGVMVSAGTEYREQPISAISMANGATRMGDKVLFCDQGIDEGAPQAGTRRSSPSQLVLVDPFSSAAPSILCNSFHGRPFNSPNDVCVHPSLNTIVFTDPSYGHEQGIKAAPQLPNAVWGLDIASQSISLLADGFVKPNGVCFSPDGSTCYVTDTGFIHGTGVVDPTIGGMIYAFDVVDQSPSLPSLRNRRVFAMVDCGAPDGIKCDSDGNVYTGIFDGVDIFNSTGTLLGKIVLPRAPDGSQSGCANLVFGPHGQLIVLSETKLYRAVIKATGALARIESAHKLQGPL